MSILVVAKLLGNSLKIAVQLGIHIGDMADNVKRIERTLWEWLQIVQQHMISRYSRQNREKYRKEKASHRGYQDFTALIE